VARNQLRSNRRYRAAVAALDPADAVDDDHAEAVTSRVDDAARLAATMRALGTLRPREREVLVLCVWEGQAYETVAATLGVPIGTIRSRLSRARARLQKAADHREPGHQLGQTTGDRNSTGRLSKEGP
jgi:RNA polymerase sigma factor (sigma-70 family)